MSALIVRTIVLCLVAGACASAPQPSSAEPISVEVARDGVVMTLSLERSTTAPGDHLGARLVVLNGGHEGVAFRSVACDLDGAIEAVPAAPPVRAPAPAQGAGPLDALRDRLVTNAAQLARFTAVTVDRPSDRDRCGIVDHGFSELAPGGRLEFLGIWPATTMLGAPAVPGDYRITAALEMLPSGAAIVPSQYQSDRDGRALEVGVGLEVTAGGLRPLTPDVAIDRILAEPNFRDVVANRAVDLRKARLAVRDGRWEIRLVLPTRGILVGAVRMDGSGSVIVQFEGG